VLFTADPAEWEEVLLSYETAANNMGLHCNWQKTKVQNVGASPAPPPVQMENQLVESVTKFTYVGLDMGVAEFKSARSWKKYLTRHRAEVQVSRIWFSQVK